MRGFKSVPVVVFLGVLAAAVFLGGATFADELIGTSDPYLVGTSDPYEDTGLYTPQSAPADRAFETGDEELLPVAPAPAVVLNSSVRRVLRPGTASGRRTTAALTLLFAVQLNSPRFKASLGAIPQAGATLGALPGVAVANATRIQGAVPVRRHLAARRVPISQPGPGAAPHPMRTALFLPEDVLLH